MIMTNFCCQRPARLLLSLAVFCAGGAQSICYFPAVYQGVYESQTVGGGGSDAQVAYSSISVLYDSIPVWGYCYRRVGGNVILKEDSGGVTCYRCFHLSLRSSNVLQIHTKGLNKCYTTEEGALATCVSQAETLSRDVSEIMMYRTKGFLGEPAVSPTYCPFNGAYTFTYSINDGTENTLECGSPVSEISDCPFGFGFNLQFKQCSFGDMEMSFHCLGDWEGRTGERFVALMDTGAALAQDRPRYRCAIYSEDPVSKRVSMALSSDSTCVSHLHSADKGYETLVLHPKQPPAWPQLAASCQFPAWLQGRWEHLNFEGDLVTYKDHRNFKTYSGKCVPHSAEGGGSSAATERFLVFTRSQCGDEVYKCIWIKERGLNTLEVQVGLYDSATPDDALCGDTNFQERTWTTQGRMEVKEKAPYMFTGEYTGVIPDTDGLCAKLNSDCNNPEIMFYTIFNCFNRSEVFEEREYECLGQWEEDGVIYTYTERRDMEGHECFVGAITKKGEIYLQEAGNNCERGQRPLEEGMRMSRVAECFYHKQFSPRLSWQLAASSSTTTTSVPKKTGSTSRQGSGSAVPRASLLSASLILVMALLPKLLWT